MKKTVLATISATALLALGACADDDVDTADDAVVTAEEPTVINEAPDTVVVDGETDSDGDRISISEDGVSADVRDGDTRVRADINGDPSLEVEVD